MADRIGQQLGNYRILRELGRGGFADVYLGEHVYLKSYAALKILHASLAERDVARFLSEAQTLVRLRHSSIVRVLEFVIEQGAPVLIMDYAPGGTLRQLYPRSTLLPLATVITHVKQVAAALHYAHSRNIIHRDVKPENLLLGEQQELLLSDFGLALLAPSPDELSTQEMAGTIPYMAPEQIRGKPGFASDQYALGIVAYEWLCGTRPFEGTIWQILQQHLEAAPPHLREKNADVPEAVEEVVLRALAKNPQQRFVSVQAFAHALERAGRASSVESSSEITAKLKRVSASSPVPLPDRSPPDSYLPYGVFLAAASADDAFAARLKADLEAPGRDLLVWNGRLAGTKYAADLEEALRQEIRAARLVLVVLSAHTRSSRTIKKQVQIAGMYGRDLLLVWESGDEWTGLLPDGWESRNVLDLIDAREVHYELALDEIVSYLVAETDATTPLEAVPTKPPEELREPRNPYKGLRAFTGADAGDFFGRDHLVNSLNEEVAGMVAAEQAASQDGRLLTVMGPSGSGKSSVVMAGLLPRLQQGAIPGSEGWVYLEPMMPGKHPIEALGLLLATRFSDRSFVSIREDLDDDSTRGLHVLARQLVKQPGMRVVLLVDQFEELFTQTEDEDERRRFIELLLTAATEPRGPLLVVLTLRADFYDRPMLYPDLHRRMQRHLVQELSMEVEELRTTIEYPAALADVQLTFEGKLVGDLLYEMQGQHGALPLLQFTLEQLFERRDGRRITLQAYCEIGGVKGALAQHAEQTYMALPSEEHRRLARSLFLRLIDPGITEQYTTRRRASLSEFTVTDVARTHLLRETIDAFIAARLLTADEVGDTTTIEVSHEAIIREWPRLSSWLREARDDITLQQGISADTAEWLRRGRPVDRLYRETELAEAEAWMERNMPSKDEMDFLKSSHAQQQQQLVAEEGRQVRELSLQRRVVGRQRLLVTALSIFSVIVLLLALVAEVGRQQADTQRQQAEKQTQIANSGALAAQANYALVQNQLDLALLLSVKANQTYNTYDARNSLLTALEYSPRVVRIQHVLESGSLISPIVLAFSPDGQAFTSFDAGGGAFAWDTKTGKQLPSSPIGINLNTTYYGLAVSPGGQLLAATASEGMWVTTKTGIQAQLEGETKGYPQGLTDWTRVAFSPDGKILASSRCSQYTSGACTQNRILLWDVASKKTTGQLLTGQTNGEVRSVIGMAFSFDGKMLASRDTDGTVQLWNTVSGRLIRQFTGSPVDLSNTPYQEEDIAFSPGGKRLALGNTDGTVTLWDVASGKLVGSPLVGHTGAVGYVAFSPDGKILASGSDDKTIQLWNVTTDYPYPIGQPLLGHTGPISSLVFSPDGKTLISSDSSTIIMWNMVADSSLNQKLEYTSSLRSAVFSSDGKVVIAGDSDGRIMLREVATGKLLDILDATMGSRQTFDPRNPFNVPLAINGLALSSNGHILASGRSDGVILLWDMAAKKPITHFSFETHAQLRSLTFNPNGRILAASYSDGTILLWDVATGHVLQHLTHHPNLWSAIAFSRDGKRLASGNDDTVILWDVATGKQIGRPLLGHTSVVEGVAFSPDGRTLASSDRESTIIFWDVSTGKTIGQPLFQVNQDSTNAGGGVTFSPNGKLLAVYNQSSVTLWDVASGEPVVHPFFQEGNDLGSPFAIVSAMFSPNGQTLLVINSCDCGPAHDHITLWNLNRDWWLALACQIANRNFTVAEWRQFANGEPYRNVCANLPVDVSVIQDYRDKAHAAALIGNSQGAISDYFLATHWALDSGDTDSSNGVCRYGSLDRFAKIVLPACDYAVKLNPSNVDYHDSRGLARTLAGDTKGAIADFSFVVQASNGYGDLNPKQIQERRQWLQELEKGRNPFDAKTLAALQQE